MERSLSGAHHYYNLTHHLSAFRCCYSSHQTASIRPGHLTSPLYTFLVQESESVKEPEMALVKEEVYWMM